MAGKTTGVYQLSNGLWAFRYTVTMNGKKKDVKKTKDESGKPFKTEKAAFRARESAIARELHSRTSKPQIPRMMMCEVYKEYCEQGRSGKAYQTILYFNEQIEKAPDDEAKKQLEMELQYSLSQYETQIKNLSRT